MGALPPAPPDVALDADSAPPPPPVDSPPVPAANGDAAEALRRAGQLGDPVLIAEELRVARQAVDRISGRAGVEDLLDALFGRFCLGK